MNGEFLEADFMHVDEGEQFEESFDGGQITDLDGLIEPPTDDLFDTTFGLMEGLQRCFQVGKSFVVDISSRQFQQT